MTVFTVLLNIFSNRCFNDLSCERDTEDGVKNFLQDSKSYHFIETDQIREASKKVHSILETLATQYGSDEYKFLDIHQANMVLEAYSLPKLLVLIISKEANVKEILSIINTVILHGSKIILIHRKVDDLGQRISQMNYPMIDPLVELRKSLEEKSRKLIQLATLHVGNDLEEEISVFLKNSEQYLISKSSEVTKRLLKIQQILTGLPEDLKYTYVNNCMFLDWKDVRELGSEYLAFALPNLIVLVSFEKEPAGLEALKQLLLEHCKLEQKKIIFITSNDKIKEYVSSNQTDFHKRRDLVHKNKQILNNFSKAYLNTLPNEINQNFDISEFLSNRDRNYAVIETPYVISAATALRRNIQTLTGNLRYRYSLDNYIFLHWEQVENLKNNFGLTFKLPNLLVLICQTHPSDSARNLLENLMFNLSFNNRKRLVVVTDQEHLKEDLQRIDKNIKRKEPPEFKEDDENRNDAKRRKIDPNTFTLSKAAENGKLDEVKLRLETGSKIDACAPGSSIRPIERAAMKGHFYMVLYLIRHRAEFDWDNTTNPLHRAAMNGHVNVATVLLENDATIGARNANGETALHLAIKHGHFEMVKTLIGFHADLQAVDNEKNTPLHEAAKYNQSEIANFLLGLDASHEARNDRDLTPLHIAVENGNESIVKHLAEHGADVNSMTTEAGGYAKRPLHIAVKCGHDKIVEFLLKFHADINRKTSDNETVFDLEKLSENPNVKTVLNRYMKDA